MSDREARIRLQLVAGNYLQGLGQVAATTKAQLASVSSAMGTMGMAGLRNVKSTLGNMAGEMKSKLSTAASFGGIFASGAAIHKAEELRATYGKIAFAVERASGKMTTWQDVQKTVEPAAKATSRSSTEMAEAYLDMLSETGNADFAAKTLKTLGVHANASKESVKDLSSVAGALNEKFGVTAETMPSALGTMIDLSKKGGVEFEDLTKVISILGASAKASGLSGEEGVKRMIAMANIGDDSLGSLKKGLSAITQLMDQMATPELQKSLKQAFGVDVKNKSGEIRDFSAVLGDILVKTKGSRESLGKAFKGEQLKFVLGMAAPFSETFEKTKGDVKTKQAAALKAFEDNLKRAGTSTYSYADATEKSAREMKEPGRQLALAIETFTQEFTKPEILESMHGMAKNAPKVAEGLAKIMNFAFKNPLLAGAGYVGARIGLSFASGMLSQAGTAIGTYAAAQIKASAASMGVWKTAGAALGIAAAAYIAYKLGEEQIDKAAKKDMEQASGLTGAAASGWSAAQGKSEGRKREALKILNERIAAAEEERKGRKEGVLNKITGGAYADVRNLVGENELAQAKAAAKELEQSLAKGSKGGDRAAQSFNMVADAAERATKALNKVEKPGGEGGDNNGVPPGGGGVPGFVPR